MGCEKDYDYKQKKKIRTSQINTQKVKIIRKVS